MYTFIHTTNCGGSSIDNFFRRYYKQIIYSEPYCELKCEENNNPIIIVRNPLERFISIYKYWKHYHGHTYKNYTINDFVSKIINGNLLFNEDYAPITNWINDVPYNKIIIILYCNNLNEKIQKLLDELKIRNKGFTLYKYSINNNEEIILDDTTINFISEYYKDDFQLYDQIIDNPELFKMVI